MNFLLALLAPKVLLAALAGMVAITGWQELRVRDARHATDQANKALAAEQLVAANLRVNIGELRSEAAANLANAHAQARKEIDRVEASKNKLVGEVRAQAEKELAQFGVAANAADGLRDRAIDAAVRTARAAAARQVLCAQPADRSTPAPAQSPAAGVRERVSRGLGQAVDGVAAGIGQSQR